LRKPLIGDRVLVEPKTDNQRKVVECWPTSTVLFLTGIAGTGKTHLSLGLALTDALNHRRDDGPKPKIMLTRAMVGCDEEPGLFPGDVEHKLLPWLAPFVDVLSNLTNDKWETLREEVDIELVPTSLLRGRTVGKNQVLIADECQSMTYNQLVCLLTRVGVGGKVILCGDPSQSDRFSASKCPLSEVAKKLTGLKGVSVVRFTSADQQRSELVNAILDRL
jgi:phosphate starvation-inducible protein PhoH and related proteins